jgi:hypothetical protein
METFWAAGSVGAAATGGAVAYGLLPCRGRTMDSFILLEFPSREWASCWEAELSGTNGELA